VHERQVVVGDLLPASAQGTEVVVPAVGSFDDPTARLLANRARECRLASTTDMRSDTSSTGLLLGFLVVIALVEAQILRTPWPARSADVHGVECLADHVHVVDVGTGQRDGKGDSLAVYESMALGAQFGAIGWIGSREVPPFGAFTLALSRDVQSHSMPTLPS